MMPLGSHILAGCAAILGALLLVIAWPVDGWDSKWAEVIVENEVLEPVLIDLRWRDRGIEIAGPIARRVAPGEAAEFGAPVGDSVCLRVIAGDSGRTVTAMHLPVSESATRVRIRLDRQSLYQPTSAAIRCEPALAAHKVRVAPGRYFELDRPDRIRRERILTRQW